MLPELVCQLVSSSPCVGFSGSRSSIPVSPAVVETLAFLSPPVVAVGCQRGVDAAFRAAIPNAKVFTVEGRERWQYVARSRACIEFVAEKGGAWISFPSSPCPVGLLPSPKPSKCFSGKGSGTWASLALARGLGLPCAVFLGSIPCPVGFGLRPVGAGWFVA